MQLTEAHVKSKTIAILGIFSYLLAVFASATNVDGESTAPVLLIVLSSLATIAFTILATLRLWTTRKKLSLLLLVSSIAYFLLKREVVTQQINPIIVTFHAFGIIRGISLIWAFVVLWRRVDGTPPIRMLAATSAVSPKTSVAVIFECQQCGQRISAANETAGSTVRCHQCDTPSVVPTSIERANEIVDRISDVLIKKDYMFENVTSLSRVGASTRLEVLHALYIVTAQTFQQAFRQPESSHSQRVFAEFVLGAGHVECSVSYSYFSDAELALIAKIPNPLDQYAKSSELSLSDLKSAHEFRQEVSRLRDLAMNDSDCLKAETLDSFICFLKAINPASRDYWARVYCRVGLPCPLAVVPDARQVPSRERVIERTATGHVPGAVDEDQASMDEILSKQGHDDAAQTEATPREHEYRESELQFGDAADSSDIAACQDLETLVASEAMSERPPQTTFSPLIVGVVALWVILATNPTTRPFVSFLGLVLVINVTHVCATAVTGLLSRVPIKEIRLFFAPNLAVVLVGRMVVRVGSIPIGGSVHFWEDERQDKPSERGGRVWPLGWKLALHLSGPLAVFLVSSICMGSLEAGRSLVTGFFQVVLGGLSPLSEGPVMIKKFADLFRSDFVTALGVLCAKWVAFHLLPIPPANGGMALLAPFQNWLEKSTRATWCYGVVFLIGFFFVYALLIGWSIAMAKYALDRIL